MRLFVFSQNAMFSPRFFTVLACCLFVGILAGCPPPVPNPPDNPVIPEPPTWGSGLKIEIVKIVIPADLRPEVQFKITDNAGHPVALSELTDARMMLGVLENRDDGTRDRFASYSTTKDDPDGKPNSGDETVQAAYDSARLSGVTANDDDTYTYKFATALPADYNVAATHQLGAQFRRLYPIDAQIYPFNLTYRFLPNGGTVTATREIVNTETCNGCHTRLSAHGSRREVQLCILCHNRQSTDAQTGNSLDFATMVHKIHRGAELPSVLAGEPYQIISRGEAADYSTVEFPQDIRNCEVCHQGAPQADAYKMEPTRAGCGACHDRTWFGDPDQIQEGFEDHVGGMQVDDRLCKLCHTATRPGSSPIVEAHMIPTQSDSAPGLALQVLQAEPLLTKAGTLLRIEFSAKNGDGSPITDLTALTSLSTTVAYPVPEYETSFREAIQGSGGPIGTLENLGNGQYAYTFKRNLPEASTDTFAVAMEGRRSFDYRGETITQGTSSNGRLLFTLDGSEPTERRAVVEQEKCDLCHNEIRAHGELRTGVDYCLMCHNPNSTDESRRPAPVMPPETVNFKDMIHKIHTGENLETGYTVYGFGGSANNLAEFRFPGDRRNCDICHADGSTDLPVAGEALPTTITQASQFVRQALPERAACTSCHDGILPNVHAIINTDEAQGIETCALCHGPDAEFAIATVHKIEP